MILEEWLDNLGGTWHNKYLYKWLKLKIIKEYSFMILENGWSVGFNENSALGGSFPISIKKIQYFKKIIWRINLKNIKEKLYLN